MFNFLFFAQIFSRLFPTHCFQCHMCWYHSLAFVRLGYSGLVPMTQFSDLPITQSQAFGCGSATLWLGGWFSSPDRTSRLSATIHWRRSRCLLDWNIP